MSEMFSIGISALRSNQSLLATVGHNIANANTDGYSRQSVSLTQRDPQYAGVGFVGKGVEVSTITRTASEFLVNNVRYSASSQSRAASYADLAGQVDNLLSDGTFSPAMQKFFSSLQDVNNDPASVPARAVLLNSADSLTDRFQDLHTRFSALSSNVNERLTANVDKLNSLASALSGLNRDIVGAFGASQGQPPNDLLDQRDQLLRQMSELVNVNVTPEQDGSVNVYIGNGQLLVAGARTVKRAVTPSATTAAGDMFQIQPTKYAARYLDVALSDAQRIAVASPVKSTATLANLGSAKISAPAVLDANNAALQTPVQLVFNSAATYQVNGVGASIAYTSGANIDINGWRVQITDSPRTGDTFQVAANTNGKGDNTNGLRLLDLRSTDFMDGGTATYQDAFSRILGQTGSLTQQAEISRDSLKVQLDSSEAAREQVAGVNLDEEAADLMRYQQSYAGAAQVIAAADAAFQMLIAALRG